MARFQCFYEWMNMTWKLEITDWDSIKAMWTILVYLLSLVSQVHSFAHLKYIMNANSEANPLYSNHHQAWHVYKKVTLFETDGKYFLFFQYFCRSNLQMWRLQELLSGLSFSFICLVAILTTTRSLEFVCLMCTVWKKS